MRLFIRTVFLPVTLAIAALWLVLGVTASSLRFSIAHFSTICVLLVLGYVTAQI